MEAEGHGHGLVPLREGPWPNLMPSQEFTDFGIMIDSLQKKKK